MQLDLFANQTPSEPAQESYGTHARRALHREAKYQAMKSEGEKDQRNWMAGKTNRLTANEALQAAGNAVKTAAPITLVLVSCVSQKTTGANKAKDLYISDWFVKARRYAERVGDKWLILSASYELLDPETVIEPYNHTLYGQRRAEREAWAGRVTGRLLKQIPPGSKIIILAGEIYREFLIPLLETKFEIEIPMLGMRIGLQKRYLKIAGDK